MHVSVEYGDIPLIPFFPEFRVGAGVQEASWGGSGACRELSHKEGIQVCGMNYERLGCSAPKRGFFPPFPTTYTSPGVLKQLGWSTRPPWKHPGRGGRTGGGRNVTSLWNPSGSTSPNQTSKRTCLFLPQCGHCNQQHFSQWLSCFQVEHFHTRPNEELFICSQLSVFSKSRTLKAAVCFESSKAELEGGKLESLVCKLTWEYLLS